MKTNRRNFIKNSALLAAGTLAVPLQAKEKYFTPPAARFKKVHGEDLWKLVRMSFPLHENYIYLNNGTMGPSPYSVIEEQQKATLHVDTTGEYGGWEDAVPALAKFTGADEKEICLTHNVTEGINIVCWGLPLKKGDEIIITNHEHVGNALPWLNRARLNGLVIKPVQLAPTAAETLNRINSLITKKTRVLAVPHIPCTQGQVLPVKEICTLARQKGIFSFIDGAHGPGMLQINLHDMGCDFYASCCHKWMLGPKGTGFLYVKQEKLDDLQAQWVGGYSDTGWDMLSDPPEMKGYVDSAHRYYYGSMSAPLYKGVVAAIDFHQAIGLDVIEARVKSLANYFYENLRQMEDRIELLTPAEETSRGAIVGFRIKNAKGDEFFPYAYRNKIRIRYVAENGLNSYRASFHIYNTFEDADALLAAINKWPEI